MFVRTVNRKSINEWSYVAALVAACLLLLNYPEAMRTGISRGLSVCATVIVPTLYPFMLLAALLTESPLCRRPGRVLSAVSRRLFGLPGCCSTAILLSLLGGYPAGATAMARLHQQRQIDDEQLRRMTAFCVIGGPGFIISTVGSGLLGSASAGGILYAAQATVAIAIGIVLGHGKREMKETATPPLPPRRPIAHIVADTCQSLLTMSGFVILAAMGLSLAEGCGLIRGLAAVSGIETGNVSALLAALTEVSCGCVALVGQGVLTPFWLSLTLSWGGLSVQGQLAAILPQMQLVGPRFWGWRLCHGLLSGVVTMGLLALFPIRQDTMTGDNAVIPYSVSTAATLMLLLLSFLAMLCFSDFSEKKTGNVS